MEKVEIKHYTVAQVRDWLEHNKAPEGLTNEVIRPAFAWAIIHHPDVRDDDPIVATIYDDNKLASATCAFPEIKVRPAFVDKDGNQKRIWWFPMLWVKPEYRGKGYGLVAIGSLAEVYGMDCAWTVWTVPESKEVFEYLGCSTYYFPRYFMGMEEKHFKTTSLRGKLAALKYASIQRWRIRQKPELPNYEYSLRYLNNVDDQSYEFICKHSSDNFFHSSQRVLNWEIQYSWSISSPLYERVPKDSQFFSYLTPLIQHLFVQVWNKNELIGVYRLILGKNELSCDFIYYIKEYSDVVFASIVEHIQRLYATHFETEDEELAKFVQKYIYFSKSTTEQLSLSISTDIKVPEHIVR